MTSNCTLYVYLYLVNENKALEITQKDVSIQYSSVGSSEICLVDINFYFLLTLAVYIIVS